MTTRVIQELESWLQKRLDNEQWHWLQERMELLAGESTERDLHITLGLIPRKLGRQDLALNADELTAAQSAREHWNPSSWTLDAAARTLTLCLAAEKDQAAFPALFSDLCRTADLSESLTLYAGLPLYPVSDGLDRQIGEGLRTNIRAVFEAVAHNNPYPAEHFDENRWNHMVLKALFIGSTLAPIHGLDKRANAELALILVDYAHERWAAGRPITPELWRCVGPFAHDKMIDDLQRVAESENEHERNAGLLALSASSDATAHKILNQFPQQVAQINNGELDWDSIKPELVT